MPDFTIIIDADHHDTSAVERALRERPGVTDLPVQSWRFLWGSVTVQKARCFGYAPHEHNGRLYFAVGRPRFVGWRHEAEGPAGFTRQIPSLVHATRPSDVYERLTGMFVLVACDDQCVTVITDRMGVYAVYDARPRIGNRVVLGTFPEAVAEHAGRLTDYDPVSLGEILLRNVATFPHTSRLGMSELSPGTLHQYRIASTGDVQYSSNTIWLPREPEHWSALRESQDELEAAIRYAGEDLTRGARCVGVTLSGGTDSRTVLAAVPPEKRALAITFADHENKETRTAARIARTASVSHHLAMRDPEFYVHLGNRESRLIGIERGFVNSHGFAAVDSPPPDPLDLILCGHLSDTLLKANYATRARLFRSPARSVRQLRAWFSNKPIFFASPAYDQLHAALRPHIQRRGLARVEQRLADLKMIRPITASEWFGFYPLSRCASIHYTLANARLFPSDQLFLHNRILDVAVTARLSHKATRRITTSAFERITGSLADITNSNTGLAASAGRWRIAWHKLRQRRSRKPPSAVRLEGSLYPWYTDGSWVDYGALHRYSKAWHDLSELCAPNAHALDLVLNDSPTRFLTEDHLPSSFNHTIVRLLLNLR